MLDIGREPQSQWVTQKPLRGLENDQTGRVRITHYPNTLLKHFYRGNTNFCTWVGSAGARCQVAECLAFCLANPIYFSTLTYSMLESILNEVLVVFCNIL